MYSWTKSFIYSKHYCTYIIINIVITDNRDVADSTTKNLASRQIFNVNTN